MYAIPFVLVLAASPVQTDLVLRGGHVLSVDGESWRENVDVLVSDGRIAGVETRRSREAVQVLDLDGAYVVPGLIDLHTHFVLYPYDQTSWNDQVLRESLELRTLRGVEAARATLHAGFTTVRELGTEGAGFADVALRDAIDAGWFPGPRIYVATRALVATGCYGPLGFDPRWDVPRGAQVADGPTGVRKATREQIAAGAQWIKVYADYRRRSGAPSTATFSPEEIQAIVDEATSAGLPVAAHASTDEAILRSIRAGVRTIEHGYEASLEVLAEMRERGVVLCPTLSASEAIARYSGWTPGQPDHPRVRTARALMARALEAGVTIACGSDAGVFEHGDNARELELLVEYGMTPVQALRAATSTAAGVLAADDLGRVDAGFLADLVVFAGDPLKDISALREPVLVVQGGEVVLDRRGEQDRSALISATEDFLAGLSRRDVDALAEQFVPGALVSASYPADEREPWLLDVAGFLERVRASNQPLLESLSAEPRVSVDGDMASVWAPFELVSAGARSRGVDAFHWVRRDGRWKIASLCYTNRADG